jgi:hypothetical protein
MSNVNSVLSVWQLVIMAVVPVAALSGWLIVIFMVAREPRADAVSSASSASEAAGATVSGQDQPPARRLAA